MAALAILQEVSRTNLDWKPKSWLPSVRKSPFTPLSYEKLMRYIIDGVLSFCAITLAVKVPRMADSKTQQVAVVVWSVILFLVYSFLLSVFRVKNSGYPFSLPPFM